MGMDAVYARRMPAWEASPLAGRIVRLEPLAESHADGLWSAAQDARTWTWMNVRRPETRAAFDELVRTALAGAAAGVEIPFATIALEDGRPVGSSRFLALRPEHRSVEIGWTWLEPAAWGTGANVEAKLLMLEHAFEAWGCRRVELKTDALNTRSRGALEALGARFEGIHRKHMLVRGGESRDSAWYAILDDDWPAVATSLRARVAARLGGNTQRLPSL